MGNRNPDGPGPSRKFAQAHPERVYGGPIPGGPVEPTPAGFPDPEVFKRQMVGMTAEQKMAHYGTLPDAHLPPLPRVAKASRILSPIICTAVAIHMVLYADFGEQEHVFSPVRRQWAKFTNDFMTLSPSERALVGLDKETASKEKK